jgi:two-component system, LytTR family, response regulator LytT
MTIRTLIVDDEPAARSRLRKALAVFPMIEILDEARDGVEAVELIGKHEPELVFLDVQMPGLDGFEVLRSLPPGRKWPLVIFATAFDKYALKAFEANAVGYLLKPMDKEKLAQAVERASRLINSPRAASEERQKLKSLAQDNPGQLEHVVARNRDRYVLVDVKDVCFFRMEDELVKVRTAARLYWTDYTMNQLEERLPSPPFLRVHRAAIVNARMIAEATPTPRGAFVLTMKDDAATEIAVSERQAKAVREMLKLCPRL